MTEIIMPKAGMAMETGKIVKWLVREGDTVQKGDMILEIETDKVNMEVEAFESGTVLKLLAGEGDEVPVTTVIGYLGEAGEQIPDIAKPAAQTLSKPARAAVLAPSPAPRTAAPLSGGSKTPATPAARRLAAEHNIDIAVAVASGHLGHVKAADVLRSAAAKQSGRIAATPLAKTLAKQRGVDLLTVVPTGHLGHVKAADIPSGAYAAFKATPLAEAIARDKGIDLAALGISGRIYSQDVERAARQQSAKAATASLMDGDTTVPLDAMRRVIASRMLQSHTEVPPVTMHTKANVTGLLAHRKQTNAQSGKKISINDYIIEACAQTLADMPEANISFGGDCIIRRGHVNIGVAVAIDGGGLIVPVLHDADHKDIAALSDEMKTLAEKARSGRLMPDEYTGGTFTISNLGMLGITYFTPIINQPESMILGVNTIEKVLHMDENKEFYNRDIMGLSLTFDHRAHDGASAAVFLQQVVEKLERFPESK